MPQPPAARLEGETLDADWKVVQRLDPGSNATGGNFSVGYVARHRDGEEAFLKALDFSDALAEADPAAALNALTEAYTYECRILEKCGSERMNRIVRAVGMGTFRFPGEVIPVPWVMFEQADGDVRAHLEASVTFDVAWALRVLHHVAIGLNQLHAGGIAHQDLKPSNVLVLVVRRPRSATSAGPTTGAITRHGAASG